MFTLGIIELSTDSATSRFASLKTRAGHPTARARTPRVPRAPDMFRRKSDETVTFHVHALQTHKAAVITGKWLSKPLSVAVIGSFLDQVRASPVVQ